MMAAATEITANDTVPTGMVKLLLRSYDGMTYRLASTKPPRDCAPEEIPIIDLTGIYSNLEARKSVAKYVLHAAETSGFFYIKNHGIPNDVVASARQKAIEFFHLPLEEKRKVAMRPSVSGYGYNGLRQTHVNPTMTRDRKESWTFHYEPEFDPTHHSTLAEVPKKVRDHIPDDKYIWEGIRNQDFKNAVLMYYRSCLCLARRLIRIIALALDLEEDYFDKYVTYPGGDMGLVFYPGHGDRLVKDLEEVGIGAHTDLQILTLLWQDEHRGLQVLNNENEWIFAPPIPGTLVVNIGDFFMRLTNDRLKSTVHRVIQHGKEDRLSMPFFFGFNFDEKLGVIPTCISEDNPPKYEPATCGELIAKRLAGGHSLQ